MDFLASNAMEALAFLYQTNPVAFPKTLFKLSKYLYVKRMRQSTKNIPRRLGFYTQKMVKPVFAARGLLEGKIITHWSQIVGERFADLSLPEKITFPLNKKTEGTLHLSVTSSGALFLQYTQDLLLERINVYFGYKAVSKIKMTHDLIKKLQSKQEKPIPILSQQDKGYVDSLTKDILDPELKECLEKLGEGVYAKAPSS